MIKVKFKKLDVNHEKRNLTFMLEVVNLLDSVTINIINAEAEVYASSSKSPNKIYLGRGLGIFHISCLPPRAELDYSVELNMDLSKIEELENLRNGARLRFYLTFFVTAILQLTAPNANIGYTPQILYLPLSHNLHLVKGIFTVIETKNNSNMIEISIDEWLDILNKLNFKHVRIIEVPALPSTKNENLEKAIENLDKAWHLMSENFEESINSCRKALECIKEFAKEKGLVKKEEENNIDFVRIYGSDTIGSCMNKMFRALWNLTNVGSHASVSKIAYRANMEFVITTVYMLLKSIIATLKV